MKATHWKIKVIYDFEKRLTKRLTWDIAILMEQMFWKKPVQKGTILFVKFVKITIMKTRLFKYIENFTTKKMKIFR